MWNRYHETASSLVEPLVARFFDQIRFTPAKARAAWRSALGSQVRINAVGLDIQRTSFRVRTTGVPAESGSRFSLPAPGSAPRSPPSASAGPPSHCLRNPDAGAEVQALPNDALPALRRGDRQGKRLGDPGRPWDPRVAAGVIGCSSLDHEDGEPVLRWLRVMVVMVCCARRLTGAPGNAAGAPPGRVTPATAILAAGGTTAGRGRGAVGEKAPGVSLGAGARIS